MDKPLDVMTKEDLLEALGDRSVEELRQFVQDDDADGIRLDFDGKARANSIWREVRPRTLRRNPTLSCGPQKYQARNLLIEGENLQTMVTLYKERGQVDLILTDPPYNTGNDFRYNDRWDTDPNDTGIGEFVEKDSPGWHTKWMKFMLPRLRVMRDMLRPNGVLAICIDHRELFRLGQMLDELFGETNRLAIINWQKASGPKNDQNHVASTTEYVLVYAKDETSARTGRVERGEGSFARYKDVDGDPRGRWREHDLTARTPSEKDQYGIQSPFTGVIHYPSGVRSWAHPKKNIKKWLEEWGVEYREMKIGDGRSPALLVVGGKAVGADQQSGTERLRTIDGTVPKSAQSAAKARLEQGNWPFIWFGLDGSGGPRPKKYLEAIRKGFVPTTYWARDEDEDPLELGSTSWEWEQSGLSQSGVKELSAVVGSGHGFETVKPMQLFMKIIQLWCPSNGLVVDPFAGSGTTGHAVLSLNDLTESHRRFICIEQGRPEKGDSYAQSLTAARLRRAITGKWATGDAAPLEGGFRFLHLQQKIDAKAVLGMERDEMTDAVIASHYDANRRGGPGLEIVTHEGHKYLVAKNADDEGFFLVWTGGKETPVLDEDVYEAIVLEAEQAKLKPMYHVYARFNHFQSDDVDFCQIPDRILFDFGVRVNDPFNNESEE